MGGSASALHAEATDEPTPETELPPVPSSIYDYGVIGNLHTAVLVSRSGSIDWACLPRFASPSVFGRILDARRGGVQALVPLEPFESAQGYLPDTNVLETRFAFEGGRALFVTDFMPVVPSARGDRAALIVRLLEATGGPVPVAAVCEPRFDYGATSARWMRSTAGTWEGCDGEQVLSVTLPWRGRADEGRLVAVGSVVPGAQVAVEILWGRERPSSGSAVELLQRTRSYWRRWVHGPEAPLHRIASRWHGYIARTELLLKLLSHIDTGAFVAAPTTSLPEWPGGGRNWDYRYVWLRDAAFTAEALLLLGHYPEARSFLRWVVARIREIPDGQHLRVVYDAHGRTDLAERELTGLSGFLGSKPVRVGNGAAEQFQLDIFGEVLDCAALLAEVEPRAVEPDWPALRQLADSVTRLKDAPDRGIWEVRGPPRHYVHSKLMAWVALDRACRLGRRFGEADSVRRWQEAADGLHEEILLHGYDRDRGTFVQAYGSTELDAANLRIPLVGFLPYTDPRVEGTVRAVEAALGEGPFVYRYRSSDGLDGPEGVFLPCSFWRIECLARAGRAAQARRDFERLLSISGPLRLLSEEFDPRTARPLGNYPQALSHIGLLRAAVALGASLTPPTLLPRVGWVLPSLRTGF